MIRRPPRSTQSRSSAASDVYKRQDRPSIQPVLGVAGHLTDRGFQIGTSAHDNVAVHDIHLVLGDPPHEGRLLENLVACGLGGKADGVAPAYGDARSPRAELSLIHISEPTRR